MGLLSGRMLNPKMLKCLLPEPAANGKPATCSHARKAAVVRRQSSCGSPGREPRNPARDVGPEILVLRSEPMNERRLLLPHDKRVEGEPHQHTEQKKARVAEQGRLAQNDGDKGNVNRIAHLAIETRHHKVLRRCDRRRRAQSLQRKACKRVDKPG